MGTGGCADEPNCESRDDNGQGLWIQAQLPKGLPDTAGMETLKVYRGGALCAQVVLGERAVEFGRAASCDVVVDDPELADHHWLAMPRKGTVVAYDVSNGTRRQARHLPIDVVPVFDGRPFQTRLERDRRNVQQQIRRTTDRRMHDHRVVQSVLGQHIFHGDAGRVLSDNRSRRLPRSFQPNLLP